MLRQKKRVAVPLAAAIAFALAQTGCGIKGPLTLPPKPDPGKAQERDAPAKRSP